MRGLLGSIVLATFLASCSGSCQQGLNGKQDWYECEGLNDLNLQIPSTAAGINITKCNISKIKTDAFSNFSNSLVQLNITGCGVEEIEPDAFRGLDKLQVLGLVSNKIQDVNASWTRGLSELKKLDLSGNGNVSIDCRVKDLMPKIAGTVHINRKPCLSPDMRPDVRKPIFMTWEG